MNDCEARRKESEESKCLLGKLGRKGGMNELGSRSRFEWTMMSSELDN